MRILPRGEARGIPRWSYRQGSGPLVPPMVGCPQLEEGLTGHTADQGYKCRGLSA